MKYLFLLLLLPFTASAQEPPRFLGSIITCTCGDGPMTAFQVYEWWGTKLPDYKYKLVQSVEAQLNCGDGKGCRVNDTALGLKPAQAVPVMYSRMIKKMRSTVTSAIAGKRITTGDDGIAVLSITDVEGATTTSGNSSGTTGSGVQYSTADMSQFTDNRNLGAMILYFGPGEKTITSAYIYSLSGKSLDDKAGVAGLLSKNIAGSYFIGYEHLPSSDCRAAEVFIKNKSGSSVMVRCAGSYKVN